MRQSMPTTSVEHGTCPHLILLIRSSCLLSANAGRLAVPTTLADKQPVAPGATDGRGFLGVERDGRVVIDWRDYEE